ncbi:MAG: hypothetical protein MZV65_36780 [Chromatiales bacterium]|nr:hypothetical protein [Chromatiales bacterium]
MPRYSLFLVEIKSRPGEIGGDAHTWVWRDGTGNISTTIPCCSPTARRKSWHRCCASN